GSCTEHLRAETHRDYGFGVAVLMSQPDLSAVQPVNPSATLSVEVWRGAATGAFQTFTVPRRLNQTVLDVVTEIQRDQDPTPSYRFACRVGMCGSCAMVVNGRPRWTCRTRLSEAAGADGAPRLAPPRHFTHR